MMKPTNGESSTVLSGDSLVPLESVLCTEELNRRPSRPPDYETENRALIALAQALADSPGTILQKMAEVMLETFQADSAGFSLLNEDGKRFHWPAIAGMWKPHIGGGTPRDFGPCGDVLDRNCTLVFTHPERRYSYLSPVSPAMVECLLVPFYANGKAVGTIWVVAHDESPDRRKFDTEDLRQLVSLGSFASSAYQAMAFLDVSKQRGEAMRELQLSQDARRAALNLMEDAVQSRQAMETLNAKIQESEERFHMLANNMSQLAWTCDLFGNVTWYNKRWLEYTGLAFEEMKGWDWMKVQHPDHVDRVVACVKDSGEKGEPWEDTFPLRGLDGTYRWFLSRALPIRDAEGRIVLWFGTNTDITELREAQTSLRENEERYRTLFAAAPMALFVCDRNAVIQHYNQRAVELWGREPTRGVAQHCGSVKLWFPDGTLLPHAQSPMVEVLRTGIPAHNVEVFIERLDGSRLPVLVNFSALKNEQGEITGAITSFIDITELKQSEAARDRLAAIIESSDDAIFSIDLNGVITSWNRGAERLFGYIAPEAVGRHMTILNPSERFDKETFIIERIRRGEYIDQYDTIRSREDGTLIDIALTISPIKNGQGEIVGISNIARDITDRKRANEELEQRVVDRTRELVQAHEQQKTLATELNLTEQRERKRLSIEMHDYLAQLLVLGKMKLAQSKGLTQTGKIRDALIDETEAVLSEALTYTRTLVIDLSPPILHESGLSAALRWLGERMQRYELTVTVQIEIDEVHIHEDRTLLLFQSVRELLMNVVKHAQVDKATVWVEQDSSNLRIEVRDQGAGFNPASVGVQDTAQSTKFGLYSIRERMRALGGRFELHSAPGKGTTAELTLPLERTEASGLRPESIRNAISHQESVITSGSEGAAPADITHQPVGNTSESKTALPMAAHPIRPIRVLLVDDHAMVRQGLRSVLGSYPDVEVVGEALNGEEAVAAAEALQPSHVVMDINMPKMSGIEATRRIRSRYPDIIVIGLSVNADRASKEVMEQAGAATLVNKGAVVDQLYRAIQETLGVKGINNKKN